MLCRYLINAKRCLVFCAVILSLWAGAAHAAPFAYISNYGSNNVSVIDTATNTVVATVAVGANPEGVAVNPAGTRAYVTNFVSNNVSVIDTAANTVVATVAVGISPTGVAVNPAGTFAYVANYGSNTVSVINTATNTVAATVAAGTGSRCVAVNPAGTFAYVTNAGSSNVSVIDTATNTVAATVAVGTTPVGVAVNPAGTRVYVGNYNSNNVSVINTATNTVVATVAVGTGPWGVAVNPAGTFAYAANYGSNTVSVINTATNIVAATVAVGTVPFGVAVNPAGTRAYVANFSSNNVSVIDTATNAVIATVAVGTNPMAFGLFIGGSLAATVPGAPTIGTATPGNGQATISFTPPASNGGSPITGYTATCNPGAFSASGAASPLTVMGLTNATAYTCSVTAANVIGTGPASATVNVTPLAGPVCYTAPSATGSGSINACFTGGGAACTYETSRFIAAPPGAFPVPPTTPGAGIVFPHGLFEFFALGCTAGSTITMTITYPSALAAGTQYWKYGPTPSNATRHWYVLPATIAGNTATFTITDGGVGDDDLLANGEIADQGGPGGGPGGGVGGASSVPTLSEWAMGVLALLLLAVAVRRYRVVNNKY